MPRINRIRVNNINYNDGTQRYDDFSMTLHGKNALYDLVNGGGKSILLMMIMQTVLPNQELDKKQPVSKLFKGNNNNTAIHSMVEWKLDKEARNWFKANYLLAGFCAKKGSEGQGEVEYFNYCITYSKYNDYDIINFPLVEGNEKIGYNGLKKKLRMLKDMDLLDCRVTLFDTNDAYKSFLSKFGIYESHWNIIRGINVSEGRVRTYIEENYRTTRKLVDKLLIEEIIEKANNMKRDKKEGEDDLSKSLMDIESKMLELSKKKKDIDTYKYQVLALEQFIAKIQDYTKTLHKEDNLWSEYERLFNLVLGNKDHIYGEFHKVSEELERNRSFGRIQNQYIEKLSLEKEKKHQEVLSLKLKELEEVVRLIKCKLDEYRDDLKYKEALKYYVLYKNDNIKYQEIISELNQLNEDKKDKLCRIQSLVYYMKDYYLNNLEKLNMDKDNYKSKLEEKSVCQELVKAESLELSERTGNLSTLINIEDVTIDKVKKEIELLNSLIRSKTSKLPENYSFASDDDLLSKYEEGLKNCNQLIEEMNQDIEMDKAVITSIQMEKKVKEETLLHINTKVTNYEKEIDEYNIQSEKILNFKKILELDSNVTTEYMLSYLSSKEDDDKKIKFIKEMKRDSLNKKLQAYREGKVTIDNEDLLKVYQYLRGISSEVELGSEYLQDKNIIEKTDILSRIPMIPYGLVVSESLYKQIGKTIHFDFMDLGSIIPIINTKAIREEEVNHNDICYLQNNVELYIEKHYVENEIIKVSSDIEKLNKEIQIYESNILNYKNLYDITKNFHDNYEIKHIKLRKDYEVTKKEQDILLSNIQILTENEENLNTRNEETINSLIDKKENQNTYIEVISGLSKRIECSNTLDQSIINRNRHIKNMEDSKKKQEINKQQETQIINDVNNLKQELKNVEDRINNITSIWETKYKTYYTDGNYPTCEFEEAYITTELNAAIKTYEDENTDVKHKNEMLQVLTNSMNQYKDEIIDRNFTLKFFEEKEKKYGYLLIHDKEIALAKDLVSKTSITYEQDRNNYYKAKTDYDTIVGKISSMNDEYSKRFSTHIEIDVQDYKDLSLAISRHKEMLKESEDALALLCKEETRISVEKNAIEKILERMEHIAQTKVVTLKVDKNQVIGLLPTSELNKKLTSLLTLMNENTRMIEERVKKCKDAKAKCVKEIATKNHGYADEIDKCDITSDINEMITLSSNLQKSKDYFVEEIQRIDDGLQEILEIKERFKSKCLQESQKIKTDLEKFTKFSKMYMDDEEIQAVKLKINYLPEEVQKSKMEKYIDRIVYDASNVLVEEDKRKLLRERLSGKSLFGVIVNEVNGMELSLYKRERVKENSRHLRFEEAVGSTGQSQGIYILLIIAIINYIARMYSNELEDKNITKTIFIDNPFGAAKDVYIWEPIMSMLRENNVQLIVPTRGVSPAMTSKFDIYYTLGQDMRGDKLQTVVTNFRSDITAEEVEYVKIESTQLDLFGIMKS
jgi:hypothetical protein